MSLAPQGNRGGLDKVKVLQDVGWDGAEVEPGDVGPLIIGDVVLVESSAIGVAESSVGEAII